MTIEELRRRILELDSMIDPEHQHSLVDEALLEYIDDPVVVAQIEEMTRWYA